MTASKALLVELADALLAATLPLRAVLSGKTTASEAAAQSLAICAPGSTRKVRHQDLAAAVDPLMDRNGPELFMATNEEQS
jgi:hypothetical protein